MRGDASDGLPGVAGVGEKTAAALLLTYGDLRGIIAAAADPDVGHGARARAARSSAAADYLDVAPTVVEVARDIDLGDFDATLPDKPAHPQILDQLAEHSTSAARSPASSTCWRADGSTGVNDSVTCRSAPGAEPSTTTHGRRLDVAGGPDVESGDPVIDPDVLEVAAAEGPRRHRTGSGGSSRRTPLHGTGHVGEATCSRYAVSGGRPSVANTHSPRARAP